MELVYPCHEDTTVNDLQGQGNVVPLHSTTLTVNAFFKQAAVYGDLYVGIGSDNTIRNLKGRETINSEDERKYMIESLKYVKQAVINTGSGHMDFVEEMKSLQPDCFVVNEDGDSPDKVKLCQELGVEYIVLKRIPEAGLPSRSTTSIRNICSIPYRIDLAGGWLDQPYVSKYHPGWVITISIEPTIEFNERSGMATSTRKKAVRLWNHSLPLQKPLKLAEILFSVENQPGTPEVSGSQDALGIAMPGLNRFFYANENYWPEKIESEYSEDILTWLEQHIYVKNLWPREDGYDVFDGSDIQKHKVSNLAEASEKCWQSILKKDVDGFASGMKAAFEAQKSMFPRMSSPAIEKVISELDKSVKGYKLSGAGGGGYLIMVSDKKVENAFQIKIRRKGNEY
jgi:galactokinase/mevalonate kinase-like predicted kinase/glycerol-3-phosphate cytidylyltransferase-like family protein